MNPLVIIQARTGSSRFPRKVLADLNGRPLLAHVVERASAIRGITGVVIATTTKERDDPVVTLASSLGVPCFRGSEDDVLDRYYRCAVAFAADSVARITGDCPFLNSEVSSAVVAAFLGDPRHFTHNIGPGTDGWDTEVMPFSMLERSWREATEPYDREHVTHWARTNLRPWVRLVKTEHIPGAAKWSVDEPADLERVRAIAREGSEIGREAKDSITGFKGKVTGLCAYINGCLQVLLTPPVGKDGVSRDGQWIDEQRVVDAKTGRPLFAKPQATAGGPQQAPATH